MSRFDRRFKRRMPGVGIVSGYSSTPVDLEPMLRAEARENGCTCTPDIEIEPPRRGEVTSARIMHDPDCPLAPADWRD